MIGICFPGYSPKAVFYLILIIILPLASCASRSEVVTAKSDLAMVRGNLQGLESNLYERQASLAEEVAGLKRDLGSLKSRDEEFRQGFAQLQQRLTVTKIETDENLKHLSNLNREYQKTQEISLQDISAKLGNLDLGIASTRRQIDEMNAPENEQNRRIGEIVNRLNVFLEEVNTENGRLKKGLLDLSQNYNQLVEMINELNKELVTLKENFKATSVRYHVIAEGETLSSIASRYGLPLDELVRINGLSNPNNVKVGQKLLLTPP